MIGNYRDDMEKHCFVYCGPERCDCQLSRDIDDLPVRDNADILHEHLAAIDEPTINKGLLAEILYTADQRHLVDFTLTEDDAIMVWRMVEIARRTKEEDADRLRDEIRM